MEVLQKTIGNSVKKSTTGRPWAESDQKTSGQQGENRFM